MNYQFNEPLKKSYLSLLNSLVLNQASYKEDSLGIFTSQIGKDYNNSLMVIGRATNSWETVINKKSTIDFQERIAKLEEDFTKGIYGDGFQWMIDKGFKKSPFLNVMSKLSNKIVGSEKDTNLHQIIWSNLYKVAPEAMGNPSDNLCRVQFEPCLEILFSEIDLFKPKVIAFFTGLNWANEFLKSKQVMNVLVNKHKYLDFVGKYNDSIIIVTKHPQGKKQDLFIEEILIEVDAFKENK